MPLLSHQVNMALALHTMRVRHAETRHHVRRVLATDDKPPARRWMGRAITLALIKRLRRIEPAVLRPVGK